MKTSIKELRYLQASGVCRNYDDLENYEKDLILKSKNYTIARAYGVYGINAVLNYTPIGLIVAFDRDVYRFGS